MLDRVTPYKSTLRGKKSLFSTVIKRIFWPKKNCLSISPLEVGQDCFVNTVTKVFDRACIALEDNWLFVIWQFTLGLCVNSDQIQFLDWMIHTCYNGLFSDFCGF
jgi:hypothetical protein